MSLRNIAICLAVVCINVAAFAYLRAVSTDAGGSVIFSPDLTLKQIARENGIPLKKILHVLSHSDASVWDIDRDRPVKELFAETSLLQKALGHAKEEEDFSRHGPKYLLWAFYLLFILLAVMNLRRIKNIRIAAMAVTILVFGVALGATPNPMESIVKLAKLINNMEKPAGAIIVCFALFTAFSLMGSKFMCSWGCQLGALQETLYNVFGLRRKRRITVPFALSLAVRIIVFSSFMVLFFSIGYGLVHRVRNFVPYHHVNYFKIFSPFDLAPIALYSLPLFALSSLLVYRPFCHFVCPFGLYSWTLENLALNKIRIDRKKCIKCGACVAACPTEAMKDIYNEKRKYFLPDCWSCGKCADACPSGAIVYGKYIR